MKPRDECLYHLVREFKEGTEAESVYFEDMLKYVRVVGFVGMSLLEHRAVAFAAIGRGRYEELRQAVAGELAQGYHPEGTTPPYSSAPTGAQCIYCGRDCTGSIARQVVYEDVDDPELNRGYKHGRVKSMGYGWRCESGCRPRVYVQGSLL